MSSCLPFKQNEAMLKPQEFDKQLGLMSNQNMWNWKYQWGTVFVNISKLITLFWIS